MSGMLLCCTMVLSLVHKHTELSRQWVPSTTPGAGNRFSRGRRPKSSGGRGRRSPGEGSEGPERGQRTLCIPRWPRPGWLWRPRSAFPRPWPGPEEPPRSSGLCGRTLGGRRSAEPTPRIPSAAVATLSDRPGELGCIVRA